MSKNDSCCNLKSLVSSEIDFNVLDANLQIANKNTNQNCFRRIENKNCQDLQLFEYHICEFHERPSPDLHGSIFLLGNIRVRLSAGFERTVQRRDTGSGIPAPTSTRTRGPTSARTPTSTFSTPSGFVKCAPCILGPLAQNAILLESVDQSLFDAF